MDTYFIHNQRREYFSFLLLDFCMTKKKRKKKKRNFVAINIGYKLNDANNIAVNLGTLKLFNFCS